MTFCPRILLIPLIIELWPSLTSIQTDVGDMMTASDKKVLAEMHYVDIRRGKPPWAAIYFDVRLCNPHSEERWFLLPRSLDNWRDIAKSGGVTSADIYEYGASETGTVRVGDFYGNGGFSAVVLPPAADVTLHRFGIASMRDLAGVQTLSIPLVITSGVLINHESAEPWFGGVARSDKRAVVTLDQGRKSHSHNANNSIELPVTLVHEEHLTLKVPIR